MWGDTSLWFWFAFPWWLVMLSIFLCACWPSACFWEKVYSDLLSIFKVNCMYFCYWVVRVFFFFNISDIYMIYKYFLPFSRLSFHFADIFLFWATFVPLYLLWAPKCRAEVPPVLDKLTAWTHPRISPQLCLYEVAQPSTHQGECGAHTAVWNSG